MSKSWYYKVNLSLYLILAIWAIGFVAPFLIAAFASSLRIAGWVAGQEYLALLVIYCNLWIRNAVFAIAFPVFTGCLVLALLLGLFFRDPPYKANGHRRRYPGSPEPQKVRQSQRTIMQKFLTLSLQMAMKQQGLGALYKRLESIVPDVSHQYNTSDMDNIYWATKIRVEQAFHARLMLKAVGDFDVHSVMDIGDSAGTHIIYLLALSGKGMRTKSLSIDHKAIEHIKRMNLEVVEADAEKYDWNKENYDMFMVFDTLEHLQNPSQFLCKLSRGTHSKVLVISVPYLERSRVRLQNIKLEQKGEIAKGSSHIYEVSPGDWRSMFKNSGWTIHYDQIYYQYPRHIPVVSRLLRWFWQRNDFEGFYGAVLTPVRGGEQ